MLPKYHIIIGFVFSIVLYLVFPEISYLEAGIVFLSSILIDFDHYVYYFYKKRSLSLKKAYNWFLKKKAYFDKLSPEKRKAYSSGSFLFLHNIEILIIILVLSFFSEIFFFVFLGFSIHLLTDWFVDWPYWRRIYKFSIIKDFINNKKLKKPFIK